MTIGTLIRDARQQKGWSISKLARRADMTEKTVGRVENGESDPKLGTVLRLVEALELDPGILGQATLELLGSHSANKYEPRNFFPRITLRDRQPSVAA